VAVKIRLKRLGKIRAPYYRIVVADSRTKRDGKAIEEIGQYHPKENPSFIQVDADRVQHWLSVGAQPSEAVLAILRKTGDWQKFAGEPAPPPLLQPERRGDRRARFDEALAQAHSGEAVSQPRTKRGKADASEGSAQAKGAAEAPAESADSSGSGAEA